MELHLITPRGAVLLAQVVDGKVIVPPPAPVGLSTPPVPDAAPKGE
jgi:hypothetical protein